jgi:hypothetical protein
MILVLLCKNAIFQKADYIMCVFCLYALFSFCCFLGAEEVNNMNKLTTRIKQPIEAITLATLRTTWIEYGIGNTECCKKSVFVSAV